MTIREWKIAGLFLALVVGVSFYDARIAKYLVAVVLVVALLTNADTLAGIVKGVVG